MERGIRKIFWEGGKTNTKKFHLINWKMARDPKDRGGIEIRETFFMNLDIGAKLV